ncbi:hypothetical protein ACSBQS_05600 [Serratia sp. H402Y]|uniref:hypothetical protein n=1 Tax=Serratia sp. H402Y TaxID=3444320 RepID=UPI003EBE827A
MGSNLVDFPSHRISEQLHYSHGSDGGGGNDMLEARVAKLESDVEYIKRDISEIKTDIKELRTIQRSDFHKLFGSLIAAAIGLAGIMAKGFGWL